MQSAAEGRDAPVWPRCNLKCLNSGKPLGTGRCEWLWSIVTWANGCLPRRYHFIFVYV